jgi:predicted RNA-binding Zn ribbon-like protein
MSSDSTSDLASLERLGGSDCLDFANTAEWNEASCLQTWLHSYCDLVIWSQQGGIVTPDLAQQLEAEAERHPDRATAVLDRALQLRAALHWLFVAIAQQHTPRSNDLATLNAELSRALPHLQLLQTNGEFKLDWVDSVLSLDRPLWAIAWSATQLLNQPAQLERVRHCAGADCGWLFLDTSRNRSRRWCDMKDCGNRAKAHRHYQKTVRNARSKP